MSYLVLARRLRPISFDDLVGQETNSKILKNAVINDRVSHAFLFAGSRGVGKTSAARILTRAINCLKTDNGNPCNTCLNCVDINENASPDIFEIDAASNRGIDNIRELRENVNYVPARCRYKVYIIDEAHMLTLESFNALLKTLEEPPPFVKFIFATTDPHKIPQTIISRCQRYDFLRIPVKQIADYLEKITKDEKLEISRKSLEMIAQNSVGGMRDALTALDQILSIENESVSDKNIAQILGILDHESRFSFTESLLTKKDKEALLHFNKLQDLGYDDNDILKDLLRTIKTTALIQTLGIKPAIFQDISIDDLKEYEKLSKILKIDELQQIFQILIQLEERLKISSYSKICFEMAILQITSIDSIIGIKEIVKEIKTYHDLEISKKKAGNDTKKRSDESKKNIYSDKLEKSNLIKIENKLDNFDDSSINDLLSSAKNNSFIEETTNSEKYKKYLRSSENIVDEIKKKNITKFIKTQEFSKDPNLSSFEVNKIDNNENIEDSNKKNHQSKKSNSLNLDNENIIGKKNIGVFENKPADDWIEFSNEARKISPKLSSFVRNSIPDSLEKSKITLRFKSGNYVSLFDDRSKGLLEKIASDLSGHIVQIDCNLKSSSSGEQTISEYEKTILDNKKELKRQNAIEYHQVKEVLSVFKNSKISSIKLVDEEN